MLKELSKKSHKLIKGLKSSKKVRIKNKCCVVEGIKSVTECIKSNHHVRYIIVSDDFCRQNLDFLEKLKGSIFTDKLFQVSSREFEELSDTITPQGIMAVVEIKYADIDILKGENLLVVALDKIQDPGNMGTMIRTADAAGANALILGKGCVDISNPKVVRSAMGSIFHIPIIKADNLMDTLITLKKSGYKVITTHLKAVKTYYDVSYKASCIIVMGSEAKGVSKGITEISDELVKIPMPGQAESLNVSIANGIIIFEAVRQRMEGTSSLL